MPKTLLILSTFFLLLTTGCLDFGDDITTTNPTQEQLDFCKAVMYLNEELVYEPIGLKILGSGIDDAVWFCFTTEETDISKIFLSEYISSDSLNKTINIYSPASMPSWWDITDKNLTGNTFELPGGTYISIGLAMNKNGIIVYIFWHQT